MTPEQVERDARMDISPKSIEELAKWLEPEGYDTLTMNGGDTRVIAHILRVQDARIRELEEALLPFSEMAGELFAKNWNNDEIAMSVNRDGKCSKLLASAFFDARAVLQREK